MTTRNTTTRDKHRAYIKRTRPPCALCGEEIDYDLPYLDPGEFVVDHIVPFSKGGADSVENKQAAHRSCNATKAARLPDEHAVRTRTFVTSRTW